MQKNPFKISDDHHLLSITCLPRLIRLRDAPAYLGMNKNYFNAHVRRSIPEISIGKRGIAFDRLDLDAWVMHYKQCSGVSSAKPERRKERCQRNTRQDSSNVGGSGT